MIEKTVITHFKEESKSPEYTYIHESVPLGFSGRVLEVGCGGRPTYMIDRYDFIGIDIVPEMLRSFKNSYPDTNLLNCDVRMLPFRTASFDMVISNMVLHHLIGKTPNISEKYIIKALKDIKKVLTPEGVIIVYDYYVGNYIFSLIMFYVTLLCAKLNIEIHLLEIRSKVVTYFLTKKKFYLICTDCGLIIRELNIKDWKRWIFRLGKVVKLLIQSKN